MESFVFFDFHFLSLLRIFIKKNWGIL